MTKINSQPQATHRYTLITNNFLEGITAIKAASLIMRDIFSNMPKPTEEIATNDEACEDEAMWAILDTIRVHSPYPKEGVPWKQQVLHIGKFELDYKNCEGVLFCWKRERVDEDTYQWVFWVVLPGEYYQEPSAGGLMSPRLERAGFIREALVA